MYAQKRVSMIENALKSLCCSNGWCYGIFWGFDQTNPLLLKFKEGYYEEQVRALIDIMLRQAYVLGGGVIGQAAFMKNHRWMHSDALDETQNSLGSFDSLECFQEDSEFFWQFSMGIKTISVISVEPWGVVQLGSTHKHYETKGFVDQVKQLFREMDKWSESKIMENEHHSDGQVFLANTGISNSVDFEGLMEENHSSVVPPQLFPFTSDDLSFPTAENSVQMESSNLFDCSSSWPHLESLFNTVDYDHWSSNDPLSFEDFGLKDEDFSACFSPLSGENKQPENLPTTSLQSSVTDAFRSCSKVDNVLDTFKVEHASGETLVDALNFTRHVPQSTSNSLFSQLGIDHLLDAVPSTSSSSLVKRRKIENFSWSHKEAKFESLASFDSKRNDIELDSEESTKEAHSCVDHRMDTGRTSTSRGQEVLVKSKKKKAKPGTRPRPKDRQMIQDRMKELRELIPNCGKMSIDRLLERTIRHLNFMQSLTKHAATLKQNGIPKSVEIMKNRSSNGGVTWACEVGDQNMVCPLIVEDLSIPGQMLIEMLCDEQGLFLEVVDIIRGFGLCINKGVMEVRDTKQIWAHFMVEAEGNRCVSRHEIFSSLIQLMQMTGKSARNDNVMSTPMPAFTNLEAFPINFPDALRCGSMQ